MGQIMRLRRIAGSDQHIVDQNNGHRHEQAITTLIKDYGLLHEAELLPRSYGGNSWFGKFHPAAGKELLSSLPVVVRGVMKRKMNIKIAIFGHKIGKQDLNAVKKIYERVESRPLRYELNLYISGEDEDPGDRPPVAATADDAMASAPGPEGSTK
jgi:succinate dehydrogenase / fumarate reductase iron-sulfur subunit